MPNPHPTLTQKPTLLTSAELRFFQALQKALGKTYLIAPKTRLADLIDCTTPAQWEAYGKKISGIHIDFTLLRPKDTHILACIELDDRSYNTGAAYAKDKIKTEILYEAAIPLIRFQVRRVYDVKEIRKAIIMAVPGAKKWL